MKYQWYILALLLPALVGGGADLVVVVAVEGQIRDQIARAWSLGHDSDSVSAIAEDVEDRFGTLQAGQTLHIALRALDSTTGLVSGVFYDSAAVV